MFASEIGTFVLCIPSLYFENFSTTEWKTKKVIYLTILCLMIARQKSKLRYKLRIAGKNIAIVR